MARQIKPKDVQTVLCPEGATVMTMSCKRLRRTLQENSNMPQPPQVVSSSSRCQRTAAAAKSAKKR